MVIGPATSTPDSIARWDSLDGTLLANSIVQIDTQGNILFDGASATGDVSQEISGNDTVSLHSEVSARLHSGDGVTFGEIVCDYDENILMDTSQGILIRVAGRTMRLAEATGASLGFFAGTGVPRISAGGSFTNNVTSGGTARTIANYTDLVIYANDAAAIRNDIYQLAAQVALISNGVRSYGLFG